MLEIKKLNVVFNENTINEKVIYESLNLDVLDDDFISIIGSNGTGKTSLFNSILGLINYDGDIILDGVCLNKMKPYKRMNQIGIVYQDPFKGTSPNLTVYENLLLASRKKHFSIKFKKEFRQKVVFDLKEFNLNLENNLDIKVKELSGGMRQALTLYMATLNKPKLLLLDEHTAALDPNTSSIIMEMTEKIVKKYKIKTLMITHNLKNAIRYGNRLILLDNKQIAIDITDKTNLDEKTLIKMYSNHLSTDSIFN